MPFKKPSNFGMSTKGPKSGLVDLDLRTYCFRKMFEIVFVNEISSEITASVKQIVDFGKRVETLSRTTFITYDDVVSFMEDLKNDSENIYLPEDIKSCLGTLVPYIYVVSNSGMPIPAALITILIKIKLIHVMYGQYTKKLEEIATYEKLENELYALAKLAGKKSAGSSKKSGRTDTGGSRRTVPADEDIAMQPIPVNPILLTDSFEEEVWFYVLSGFYDADLLPGLISVNVPVSIIVEISSLDAKIPETSQEEDATRPSPTNKVDDFWRRLDSLLFGSSRCCGLENTVLMKYEIPHGLLDNAEGDKKALQDMIDVMRSIYDLRLAHLNYVSNLKLSSLGLYADRVFVYPTHFRLYCSLLEKFPSECVTIPIILECLLEEVCSKIEGTSSSEGTCIFDQTSQETVSTDSAPHLMCSCPFSFDYFVPKKKKHPQNKRTEGAARDNTYQIHQENELESIMRCYKGAGRAVYDTTLKYMKNIMPTVLINQFKMDENRDYKHSHDRADSGCTVSEFKEQEVFHYTSLLIFLKINCHESPPKRSEVRGINRNLKLKYPLEDYEKIQPRVVEIEDLHDRNASHRKLCDVNLYEVRLLANNNWTEVLPQAVLLQDVFKCNEQFRCMDYVFCDELDALLVKYHDKLDDFGVGIKAWNEPIRTPICLRDFCRFVCAEDVDWINSQTEKNPSTRQSDTPDEEVCKGAAELSALDMYKDYAELLSTSLTEPESLEISGSTAMLAKLLDYQKYTDVRDNCIRIGDFYSHMAYDLGSNRTEVNGSTTVFKSHDGVKITADTTHFLGSQKNLSLTVASDGNDLILHRTSRFLLRLCASNGTNIVIDKAIDAVTQQRDIEQPSFDDNLRFSGVDVNSLLRRPFPSFSGASKASSRKSTDMTTSFAATPNLVEVDPDSNQHWKSSVEESARNVKNATEDSDFAQQVVIVPNLDGKSEETSTEITDFAYNPSSRRIKKASHEILEALAAALTHNRSLYKIRTRHNPRQVCRKTGDFKIPVFTVVKRILYKQAKREKCKRYVRKYVPKYQTESKDQPSSKIDLRISLPNGLTILPVQSGVCEGFTEIKQSYLIGTHPKEAEHEVYRLFTRNGLILIRHLDGHIDILQSNGEIIEFDRPCNDNHLVVDVKFGLEVKNCFRPPSCKNIYHTQKQICNLMMGKHGDPTENFVSRRAHLHKQHADLKDCEVSADMPGCKLPYAKVSILKFDGKRTSIDRKRMVQHQQYLMTHEFDHRLEEEFYTRDDGLRYIIQRDRCTCVQFRDGSRITSWFEIEPELIYINKKDGWVSVVLNFKFEHPNYATVTYKAGCDDFEIGLSDSIGVRKFNRDKFEVKLKNTVLTLLDDALQYRKTCPKCEIPFQCDINIEEFMGISNTTEKDILFARDSYNKVFRIRDLEKCSVNKNFIRGPTNSANCDHYSDRTNEKLFIIKKDYSGLLLWNNKNVETMVTNFERGDDCEVVTRTDFFGFRCLEFLRRVYCRYNQRFTNLDLLNDELKLSKYRSQGLKNNRLVCVAYRELHEITNFAKLRAIFEEIKEHLEVSGKAELDEFDSILHLTDNLQRNMEFLKQFELSSTPTEEVDDRPLCDCVQIKFTYKEKIAHWRKECGKYRDYIRTSFVPIYFMSEYYKGPSEINSSK